MITKSIRAICAAWLLIALMPAPPARANTELDRQFALQTIGALRSWDNVDGLFADYVKEAYQKYFSNQSRFRLVDLSKANELLQKSKIPYSKLIEDNEVLNQLSRSMRVDSILRTRIAKEGPTYRFHIEWLHSPHMELIAEDSFTLQEPRDGKSFGFGDVEGAIQASVHRVIKKLPWVGQITGRDNNSVTLDIGQNANLGPGDTLVIATLDEVKKHPLLKSIVDWHLTHTGKVLVDKVDDQISFGHVMEEEPGRHISRFQKVAQIIPLPKTVQTAPVTHQNPEQEREREFSEQPRLGWASAGLWLGGFSREYSTTTGAGGRKGSGIFIGARGEGQLWLTREWFAELGGAFGFAGNSQSDLNGNKSTGDSGSVNVTRFRIDAGYTYYTTPDFFGPKAWIKLGYHSTKYSLLLNPSELVAPISFNGLFLGIGGDLPIRQHWGALLTLDFGVLTSVHQTALDPGVKNSATDVRFFVGGYYRWTPRLTFRAGLDVTGDSADFAQASVTHRIITVGPSLLYYF